MYPLKPSELQAQFHATCTKPEQLEPDGDLTYHTVIRVRRLFEIIKTELTSPVTTLSCVTTSNNEEEH